MTALQHHPEPTGEFPGIYRAIVVSNDDPDKRKRLRLRVPSVAGTAVLDWAWPCFPAAHHALEVSATAVGDHGAHTHTVDDTDDNWAHKHAPKPGTQVWVMFEGGNPDYPVWIGVTG